VVDEDSQFRPPAEKWKRQARVSSTWQHARATQIKIQLAHCSRTSGGPVECIHFPPGECYSALLLICQKLRDKRQRELSSWSVQPAETLPARTTGNKPIRVTGPRASLMNSQRSELFLFPSSVRRSVSPTLGPAEISTPFESLFRPLLSKQVVCAQIKTVLMALIWPPPPQLEKQPVRPAEFLWSGKVAFCADLPTLRLRVGENLDIMVSSTKNLCAGCVCFLEESNYKRLH
jgi:hypothetical protein